MLEYKLIYNNKLNNNNSNNSNSNNNYNYSNNKSNKNNFHKIRIFTYYVNWIKNNQMQ